MRAGKNMLTNELEIYLDEDEAAELKEIVRCAKLPQRRTLFKKLMDVL
jgi:hypothetical protein